MPNIRNSRTGPQLSAREQRQHLNRRQHTMSYLTPATPLGLYGPFHCLSASPSPNISPNITPPPSRSSSSSSTSMSSFHSIQSINRILSLRRQRHRHRRNTSNTSVLPPTSLAECVREDERDVERMIGGARRKQGSALLQSGAEPVVGVMEPRPSEPVGWGIGEVLWGGRP